jgi:hypothetical protein
MRKRILFWTLVASGFIWGQNPPAYQQFPDCNVAFTLSGTVAHSAVFDNRQVGCTYWVLNTNVDSGSATGSVLVLEYAPTSAGAPGVFATFPVVSGDNPHTFDTDTSDQIQVFGLQPWIRVSYTAALASVVKGNLIGWKIRPGAGSGLPVTAFIGDGANLDAFSRLRTSNGVTLFDSQQEYSLSPFLWTTITANSGTATYTANISATKLATTGANASRAVVQSRQYIRYQPGKGQLVIVTGVLGTAGDNNSRRIGQFDDANGLFFSVDQNGAAVNLRSTVAGVLTTTRIGQADWNLDRFDGTGPSGVTLNTTRTQIFIIDYQWLGVGRIRYGLDVNGRIYYCHQIFNANNQNNVYMASANLPVRAENVNTAASTVGTEMQLICATVTSEDGFENDRGYVFSASNAGTTIATTGTTLRPALCIRPRLLFNTKPNRGQIVIEDAGITVGANLYWGLAYYSTPAGGTFVAVQTGSITETDGQSVAGTVLSTTFGTLGTIAYQSISSGPANANRVPVSVQIVNKFPITISADGATADNVCIFVQSLSGNVQWSAWLVWRELY